MQADPQIMKALEEVLAAEIAALNTYFVDAKLLARSNRTVRIRRF